MSAIKRLDVLVGLCFRAVGSCISPDHSGACRRVRALFIISCLLPGPQFLLYLALWIILPSE